MATHVVGCPRRDRSGRDAGKAGLGCDMGGDRCSGPIQIRKVDNTVVSTCMCPLPPEPLHVCQGAGSARDAHLVGMLRATGMERAVLL